MAALDTVCESLTGPSTAAHLFLAQSMHAGVWAPSLIPIPFPLCSQQLCYIQRAVSCSGVGAALLTSTLPSSKFLFSCNLRSGLFLHVSMLFLTIY